MWGVFARPWARLSRTLPSLSRRVLLDETADQHLSVVGRGDDRWGLRVRLHELSGGDVLLDVVDQRRAARREGRPHLLELEQDVPSGMPAVVEEQVQLPQLGDQGRQ